MLKVSKEHRGSALYVTLSGQIDEHADLEGQIGVVNQPLYLNCKDIDRLTSDGVKTWIRFFQDLQRREIQVFFQECSPAVVNQINLIYNFLCGGEVRSIYLPFICQHCKKAYFMKISLRKLRQTYKKLSRPDCPVCKQQMVFDDVESEYFTFLERESSKPKTATRTLLKRGRK